MTFWAKIKLNWKFFALLAAGGAAMAILVAVILLRREDRDFMRRKCVPTANAADPIMWKPGDFPLMVAIDPIAGEELDETLTKVLGRWNSIGSKKFFNDPIRLGEHVRHRCGEAGDPRDPVIFVTRTNSDGTAWSDENPDGPGHALAFWNSTCRIRCVEIHFPGQASKSLWEKIAMHEFGHALGLDHDDYESSVMYYGRKAMNWGMDTITEKDRMTLGTAYK